MQNVVLHYGGEFQPLQVCEDVFENFTFHVYFIPHRNIAKVTENSCKVPLALYMNPG